MPAWITPLLCVLVSIPAWGCRSSRQTARSGHRSATALADASPVTPPPTTTTSTRSMVVSSQPSAVSCQLKVFTEDCYGRSAIAA